MLIYYDCVKQKRSEWKQKSAKKHLPETVFVLLYFHVVDFSKQCGDITDHRLGRLPFYIGTV
jgi:hypothetical protein